MLNITEPTSAGYARLTGLFYLIIAIFGCLTILYTNSHYINEPSVAAMRQAYLNHLGMAKLEIYGTFILMIAEIFATSMLFQMFKSVNETLSRIALFARFGMVAVMAVMVFAQINNLQLATGAKWFANLDENTSLALAGLFFSFTINGVIIWQVFFATHLCILGWLVIRSARFPKIIGTGMMIGAWGYLLDSLNKIEPNLPISLSVIIGILLTIVTFAELGFTLWLLIKGQKQITN